MKTRIGIGFIFIMLCCLFLFVLAITLLYKDCYNNWSLIKSLKLKDCVFLLACFYIFLLAVNTKYQIEVTEDSIIVSSLFRKYCFDLNGHTKIGESIESSRLPWDKLYYSLKFKNEKYSCTCSSFSVRDYNEVRSVLAHHITIEKR